MEIEKNEEQCRGCRAAPHPSQRGAPSCCVLMTEYRVARIHGNNSHCLEKISIQFQLTEK